MAASPNTIAAALAPPRSGPLASALARAWWLLLQQPVQFTQHAIALGCFASGIGVELAPSSVLAISAMVDNDRIRR